MTSKERVLAAIQFRKPDRVPVSVRFIPAVYLAHGAKLEELLARYPPDLLDPVFPRRWDPDKVDPRYMPGRFTDEWGSVWYGTHAGYQGRVARYALDDWRSLDGFVPPKPEANCPWAGIPDKFCVAIGANFFHRMCYLRSMEKVLMDIHDVVPEIYRLRDILLEHFIQQTRLGAAQEVDGVWFLDDFGTQRSLLMSPAMWRRFIRPVYEKLFAICKSMRKLIFFHSDGFIIDLIDDLIDMGVDVLNCQATMIGLERLAERFRGRLTFWGEFSWQSMVPYGTPDEIRAEAMKMANTLGTSEGGFIGLAQGDGLTPLPNLEAMMTAWS